MDNTNSKVSTDLIERTVQQAERLEKLAADAGPEPDVNTAAKLEMEMDKLAVYLNTARGDHANRARTAIETARATVLGKAITQPLPPLKKLDD